MPERYLGIDLGGTKIAAVVADEKGSVLFRERRPTRPGRGVEAVVDEMVAMASIVAGNAGIAAAEARALGVSFGGPIDSRRGIVYSPANLPGWDAIPLLEMLEARLPDLPIVLDNDANAAALAEWRFGAGRGFDHVLYMTMGTGIGGGIVSDGRLVRGSRDAAGEVGHMCLVHDGPVCGCGKRGCLEAFCSGPAIARRAVEKLRAGASRHGLAEGVPLTELRTEHLVAAAREGNPFALEHLRETAYYMAWGIGNALNLLNPEVVILGTVATAAGDLFLDDVRGYLPLFAMPRAAADARIVPAELGETVGDYAAIALAMGV
ncbi:ROK family protein [Candidatus Poribacteria bacterium]|nr:ROK family protein [Candidatus Poribacteria bacterium]